MHRQTSRYDAGHGQQRRFRFKVIHRNRLDWAGHRGLGPQPPRGQSCDARMNEHTLSAHAMVAAFAKQIN